MALRSGSEQPSQPQIDHSSVCAHKQDTTHASVPKVSVSSANSAKHTVWLLGVAPEVAQVLSQHEVSVTSHLHTPQSFTSGRAVNAVLALHTQEQPNTLWLRLPPQISITGTSKDRRRGKHVVQLIKAQVNSGYSLIVDGVSTLATWQQPCVHECLFTPGFTHIDMQHEKRPWRCVVSGINMNVSTGAGPQSLSALLCDHCLCDGSGAELKANQSLCPTTCSVAGCACPAETSTLLANTQIGDHQLQTKRKDKHKRAQPTLEDHFDDCGTDMTGLDDGVFLLSSPCTCPTSHTDPCVLVPFLRAQE
eukprot:6492101-Amphidinium_carterae.1